MRALPYLVIALGFILACAGGYYGAYLNDAYAMALYAIPGLIVVWMVPVCFGGEQWQTYIKGRMYAKRMQAIRLGRRGF